MSAFKFGGYFVGKYYTILGLDPITQDINSLSPSDAYMRQ